MLQALDMQTGMAVTADEAKREARYVCPECSRLVGLRRGARRVPYFAHYVRDVCALARPEGPRHQALKLLCKRFFAPLPVLFEMRVGQRRVDALVDGLFVVECQVSPLGIGEWQARTANHNRQGFPDLWLWDIKRLCRKNSLAEALALERNQRPVWTAAEIRFCHAESRELLFVADKHDIKPCRLQVLTPGEQAAARRLGGACPDACFWPHALRKIAFQPGFDKSARFHFASQTKKLRLVRFTLAGPGDSNVT